MFRPLIIAASLLSLLACGSLLFVQNGAAQQSTSAQNNNAPASNANTSTRQNNSNSSAQRPNENNNPSARNATAEQVAEYAVFIYGTRPGLKQIRSKGVEHGRNIRTGSDGRTEESIYDRRFIRGERTEQDRIRLDQKTPTLEYSLIYGSGKLWGLINGATFTPRHETTVDFLSDMWHGIDALLRYKENGSKLNLVGREKRQGIDLYMLDVTDTQNRKTRFYVSSRTWRVLWLEYEEPATEGGPVVKYQRRFYDYRYAQGTLVPFRSVLYEDGHQTQENNIMTVTYGVRLENSLFENPENSTTASQP
ncbi:MAG: hypothetical protein AUG51_07615 [Acidobacteria bacterium 13_1_20CM_3_53_8]|nr:MAG: hypothetical protein AUG51_07615 [Acidobacteria bacterium 13_1_20CM_3_53_8]